MAPKNKKVRVKVPLSQEVRGGVAGEEGGKPKCGFTEGFKKKCPAAANRAYGKTDARPGVTAKGQGDT